MTARLATAEDAKIIIKLLAQTGQLWSDERAKETLADSNHMIVIHEDAAGQPDGVFVLRRMPSISVLGPVSPSPRESGRTRTVLEMAGFMYQEARKKWPSDFVRGRRVIARVWERDAQDQLKAALGNTITVSAHDAVGEEYSFDLIAVKDALKAYVETSI
jgi:hypothetical protein